VGRLRLDLHRESVAFTADAFDLDHERILSASRGPAGLAADRGPPVRNRGPVAQALSTVSAILSGSLTAPLAWASRTSRRARRWRSKAERSWAPPSGDDNTPWTNRCNETCSLSSVVDAIQASRFHRARWASHSPARAVRGASWVHAAQRAISRSRSALGTKDIGSSSITCLSSVNKSGSR